MRTLMRFWPEIAWLVLALTIIITLLTGHADDQWHYILTLLGWFLGFVTALLVGLYSSNRRKARVNQDE